MEYEATMKIDRSLDRAAIESRLEEIRLFAAARGQPAVAHLLQGALGKSRDEIDKRVRQSLALLGALPDGRQMAAKLETVQLSLGNLA